MRAAEERPVAFGCKDFAGAVFELDKSPDTGFYVTRKFISRGQTRNDTIWA